MIASKFGIGQQVRHTLLGYLGVIVDVDPEYSLAEPEEDEIAANDELRAAPWYHVVMEDDDGQPIHTYLAEAQLSSETRDEHPEQPSLDELAKRFVSSCRLRAFATKTKPRQAGFFVILLIPVAVVQWPGSDPSLRSIRLPWPAPQPAH